MILLEIDWSAFILEYLVKLPLAVVVLIGIGYFIFIKIEINKNDKLSINLKVFNNKCCIKIF